MAEKFETEGEIDRRVLALSEEKAKSILASLISGLYGPESDKDWNADTFEAIQGLLHMNGLTP